MEPGRQNLASAPPPEGVARKPLILLIAALVLAGGIYFIFFHSPAVSPIPPAPRLPFGPEEQAYAAKLTFSNMAMSRAENFLHQEVTILSGDVANDGDRFVRALDVTITFQDEMQQIVLRETRPVFGPNAAPLEPGKSTHFDISFDHVPPSWNVQVPSVHVAGLEFAGTKK